MSRAERIVGGGLLLMLVSIVIYHPLLSPSAQWVFEDLHQIAVWAGPAPLPGVFGQLPLWLHRLVPAVPAAQHALSLAIHVINAVLLGWLVWRLTCREAFAWLAAVIWLVHPLPLQAVAYASALGEVVTGTGALLVAHLLLTPWSIWTLLGLLVVLPDAALVKPSAIGVAALPLVLGVGGRGAREPWWVGAGLGVLVGAVLVGAGLAGLPLVGGVARATWQNPDWLAVMEIQATAVWGLAWQVVWPAQVAIQTDWTMVPLAARGVALAALAWLLPLSECVWRRGWPGVAMGVAWWVVLLAPRVLVLAQGVSWREPEYVYGYQIYAAAMGLVIAGCAAGAGWLERVALQAAAEQQP